MYFACTHILNIYSFFFFLIPTFLHYFPPCLLQLIRGLILTAFCALIVMYKHISLVSGLSNKWILFFFPPVYTEITVFHPFGIFPYRKQALKCSPLLVHEEITVAFQSQHGVVFH